MSNTFVTVFINICKLIQIQLVIIMFMLVHSALTNVNKYNL